MDYVKKLAPGRLIALGFASVIALGTVLLSLPVSAREGVRVPLLDALFTSTSAVCVTGLVAVDTADTFSVFGRTVVALLIQIGGLGVTCVGVGFILLAGKRISFKSRLMVKEAWNVSTLQGLVRLVRAVLIMTLIIEGAGVLLSLPVFLRDHAPADALGISVFHSVAAFNNAGFDILGGMRSLIPYRDDVLLNLTTCALIILGGIGFLVILDVLEKRRFKTLRLHSKVVILLSVILIGAGTLVLRMTDDLTWLQAFFQSVSTRTAGFATCSIGDLSNAGLLAMTLLMFVGASPGSTGGGIKTTTLFAMFQAIRSVATNQAPAAFHRTIPQVVIVKAFHIMLLSTLFVYTGTFLLCILEPEYSLIQCLVEVTSAFATVGLSTGITPELGAAGKLLIILVMYVGRLGPLTIASLWAFRPEAQIHYSEENITIG